MSKYVDGFVLVIPKSKAEEYKKMADGGRDLWMKCGAIGYYECRGNDLKPQVMGDVSTRVFTEMAGANKDEEVWFSFIIFKSKAHRDQVNAKVMVEMEEHAKNNEDMSVPFEMKRMAYGGFQVEVEG